MIPFAEVGMARARPVISLDQVQGADGVRQAWRFERIGWGVIVLAIAGGLAGAFGDGLLSSASRLSRFVFAHFPIAWSFRCCDPIRPAR